MIKVRRVESTRINNEEKFRLANQNANCLVEDEVYKSILHTRWILITSLSGRMWQLLFIIDGVSSLFRIIITLLTGRICQLCLIVDGVRSFCIIIIILLTGKVCQLFIIVDRG